MNSLCGFIKEQADINFINLETALKTYDRNALVCGAPAWRYAYHTIHSADKWFFNPCKYNEPDFHKAGMDNPDEPCDVVLSDEELLGYMNEVRLKTRAYIEGLTDKMLYEKPEGCRYTRFELVLLQFRHISFHTGMINGQTAERTGRFPVYVGAEGLGKLRTCLHKHMRTSFRQILPQTALKILAGRQPACGFLPCLQQNYARKSAHISYEDRFLNMDFTTSDKI